MQLNNKLIFRFNNNKLLSVISTSLTMPYLKSFLKNGCRYITVADEDHPIKCFIKKRTAKYIVNMKILFNSGD